MPRVLIAVSGKNAQPYRFSLDRKVVRLGRASDNDIVVDCPSVSSHHCEMRRVDGGYILKDLKSTNGIKLDDGRMEIIDLENGQDLLVGDANLEFELTKDELKELSKEDHTPQQRAQLPEIEKDEDGKSEGKKKEQPKAKPRPKSLSQPPRRPAAAPLASAQQQSGGMNFLITMIFLFLAALAFYLGLNTKHNAKYPGESLWEVMFSDDKPGEDTK